jgi:hypothetical protein
MVIDLAYFEGGENNNSDYRFVRIKIIFGLEIDQTYFSKYFKFLGKVKECFG